MLSRFKIIVAVDAKNGIAKDGDIPWRVLNAPGARTDMNYFKEMTIGAGNLGNKGRSCIIVGRGTYETIPHEFRPLPKRKNIVVSQSWRQEDHPECVVAESMKRALQIAKKYTNVWVIGGATIYRQAIEDFMYLCDQIHYTRLKNDFACDLFFPVDRELLDSIPLFESPYKCQSFDRKIYHVSKRFDEDGIPIERWSHEEHHYLRLLSDIVNTTDIRPDRTGDGTKSIFGRSLTFDCSTRLPMITTKEVPFKWIVEELLWFVSGSTDVTILQEKGITIWNANTEGERLAELGLDHYDEYDLGPGYGFQARFSGAEYVNCKTDYTGQGVDQLQGIIDGIRDDPFGRRHVMTYWNPSDIDKMALPPCHGNIIQFYVSTDEQSLHMNMYQRSADCFLGLPWNITSYALLLYMVSYLVRKTPGTLTITIGDAHVYVSHLDKVERQLKRMPIPFPKLKWKNVHRINTIDDFNVKNFHLVGYDPWERISAEMMV